MIVAQTFESPIGPLTAAERAGRVCLLQFGADGSQTDKIFERWYPGERRTRQPLPAVGAALSRYFAAGLAGGALGGGAALRPGLAIRTSSGTGEFWLGHCRIAPLGNRGYRSRPRDYAKKMEGSTASLSSGKTGPARPGAVRPGPGVDAASTVAKPTDR